MGQNIRTEPLKWCDWLASQRFLLLTKESVSHRTIQKNMFVVMQTTALKLNLIYEYVSYLDIRIYYIDI